ncbi:MAG TPA: ABC transporter permease [Micromonosporaceae bacterium]|nr:ABC transporter permease [Micromonosporaceae bacterium]
MAYDESSYRRHDAQSADDQPTLGFPVGDFRGSEPVTAADRTVLLDEIFDDPEHGEPGRDRIGVHAFWELLLLLGTAALAFLVYQTNPDVLRGAELDALLVSATGLGLLVLAAGLALRANVPNLALGPVAVAVAYEIGEFADRSPAQIIGFVAVAAALLGLALALFVVVFHVPAWAASLAVGFAVVVFLDQRAAPAQLPDDLELNRHSFYLFGGFAAVALLAGLFGTVKPLRRAIGRFRPVSDPALRRGAGAVVVAGGAIVLSMVLAGLAGVLMVASSPAVPVSSGIEWSGLALGAALLAGTSAYGRRGGVFGTVLVVALLALFGVYSAERGWEVPTGAVAAAMIGAGLVVTRLVETFGRPRSATAGADDVEVAANTSSWSGGDGDQQESWSAALPAQPTEGLGGWGAADR